LRTKYKKKLNNFKILHIRIAPLYGTTGWDPLRCVGVPGPGGRFSTIKPYENAAPHRRLNANLLILLTSLHYQIHYPVVWQYLRLDYWQVL
jgi:hypothetical protein